MGPLPSLTDEALLQAAIAGVQEAWAELVQRYHGTGMRIIRRQIGDPHLAEDILQNLWASLVVAVRRQPPDSFAALFHTLLKRRIVDELRRQGRTKEAAILDSAPAAEEGQGQSLLEHQAADTPSPVDEAIRSDESHRIHRAMEKIPDHYRRTLEARVFQGLSNKETARLLISEGLVPAEDGAEKRVENYYYRGLKELGRQLTAMGYEYRGGTRI